MASSSSFIDDDDNNDASNEYEYYDKSIPHLREWELDVNSTRYDKSLAAPSDSTLIKYWMGWAILALTAGIFVFGIFLALVTSKQVRRQSFNVYLIYLMIPDFVFSLCCGITCLMNSINGSYYSHWMCNFQQWYCVWGIGSNCWLNASITFQLHSLLKCNNQRRRYQVPPPKTVTIYAMIIYIYCAFLGTWGLFANQNFPYHTLQISGLACIPVETDLQSSLFFWLFFMPLFSLIPIGYVIYVAIDIYCRKLLPTRGKRRLLTIYFGRIIFVFLAFWGPYFLLNYVFATLVPTWVLYVGGIFSHLQGPVSAGVSLLKPDIWHAVVTFWTCRRCRCCHVPNQHGERDDEENTNLRHHRRNTGEVFIWYGIASSSSMISRHSENGRGRGSSSRGGGGGGGSTQQQNLQPSFVKRLFVGISSFSMTKTSEHMNRHHQHHHDQGDDDKTHSQVTSRIPNDESHYSTTASNSGGGGPPPPEIISYGGVWPDEDGFHRGDDLDPNYDSDEHDDNDNNDEQVGTGTGTGGNTDSDNDHGNNGVQVAEEQYDVGQQRQQQHEEEI